MDLMALFLKVLNMSIAASWVVLAVLVLRFVLKKAPKWINVALWGLVAVRLVCPFSFESVLSLIPSTETVPEAFLYMEGEDLHRDAYLNVAEDTAVYASATVELDAPVDAVMKQEMAASILWLGGMGAMAAYALFSYLGLNKKVAASIHLSEEIFLCDYIDTPFILGVWKPKIYLPSSMDPDAATHVLSHERAHLKRKDHWWKPLGFLLLTIHWFNPILWLAYCLLCRDIELACDERVVREMGVADKKAYSEALLRCSVSRKMIAACPLAFGEVGVKERVKSVLNYKKPGFWIILVAVIALVIAAVCFLTDPITRQNDQKTYPMSGSNLSDIDTQQILKQIRKYNGLQDTENMYMNSRGFTLLLDENFDFAASSVQYFFYEEQQIYSSVLIFVPLADSFTLLGTEEWEEQESLFLLHHYLEALRCLPQEQIRSLTPNAERYTIRHVEEGSPASYDRVIRYASGGIGSTDGWYIHLEVTPMNRNPENGDWMKMKEEAVHLFYGDGRPDIDGIILDAKVLEITGEAFLVEPVPGSWELDSADKIWVPMQNMQASPEPQVGDILRIHYDGQLLESYPAQIEDVFRIRVVTEEYNIDMETAS